MDNKEKTIWLTINRMVELFGVDKSGISRHLKTSMKVENWAGQQLLQNLQQFKLKVAERSQESLSRLIRKSI